MLVATTRILLFFFALLEAVLLLAIGAFLGLAPRVAHVTAFLAFPFGHFLTSPIGNEHQILAYPWSFSRVNEHSTMGFLSYASRSNFDRMSLAGIRYWGKEPGRNMLLD
jgi:hypothetical protein